MASVWVDIDLDEVTTSELLDELENRYLRAHEKQCILKLLREDDELKYDLFFQFKDKFSISEFEEMFKEKSINTTTPKEQLKISF